MSPPASRESCPATEVAFCWGGGDGARVEKEDVAGVEMWANMVGAKCAARCELSLPARFTQHERKSHSYSGFRCGRLKLQNGNCSFLRRFFFVLSHAGCGTSSGREVFDPKMFEILNVYSGSHFFGKKKRESPHIFGGPGGVRGVLGEGVRGMGA